MDGDQLAEIGVVKRTTADAPARRRSVTFSSSAAQRRISLTGCWGRRFTQEGSIDRYASLTDFTLSPRPSLTTSQLTYSCHNVPSASLAVVE